MSRWYSGLWRSILQTISNVFFWPFQYPSNIAGLRHCLWRIFSDLPVAWWELRLMVRLMWSHKMPYMCHFKNITLVMHGPFKKKQNYNKTYYRCNCVYKFMEKHEFIFDRHDFIRPMRNLNKHVFSLHTFHPPWDVDGNQRPAIRMGPTLIQHFGMSQLQFGTLTTAFALAK